MRLLKPFREKLKSFHMRNRHHKDICEFEALRNTPSPRDVVLKAAEVLGYWKWLSMNGNTFKTPTLL